MDTPTAPIPSVPLQPAVPPAETSSRRWFLWSAIGLAILIFGIAIGIFSVKFLNRSQSQSQLPSTPTLVPLPSVTSVQEADLTANWNLHKITHDPVMGYPDYEIKLPLSWKQVEHSSNFQNSETFQDLNKESNIQIDIHNNSSKNLADFLTKFDKENQTAWEGKPSKRVINTQTTKRGTHDVVEREEDWLAAGFTAKVIYIPANNFVLSVAAFPYNVEGTLSTETFDQILSTFKFVE